MTTISSYNPSNNYTVSSTEISESVGDGISGVLEGTMVTQGTLTITPDGGYVVSASNFSITGDLPSEVSSVTFTDTTTAGQVGNLVTVTATFASDFEISEAYQIIYLDIDGSAEEYSPDLIDYVFDLSVTLPDFSDVILTPPTGVTVNSVTTGNVQVMTVSGQTNANETTNVGTVTINADTGYQIDNQPYLSYNNMPSGLVSLSFVSKQTNSPQVTSYVFNLIFRSSVTVKENKSSKAILNYTISEIPASITRTSILEVVRGNSDISILGETRPITIFGDSGAEFDITVTKDSDGSSILDANEVNTTILSPEYGSINAINKKLPTGNGIQSFTFNQVFPTNTAIQSTTIKTTQTSTTVSLNATTANIKVGDQLVYDDITDADNLAAVGNVTPVTVSSITNASDVVVSSSLIQASSDSVEFRRTEKYYINIYPKNATTLGSNIPTIKPNYTLYQRPHPLLTLTAQAGTRYGLSTYSKVTYNGRANAKGNKLKGLSGVSGTTATSNYNKDSFSVTWIATATDTAAHTFTTADNPVWSSTNVYDASDATSSDFDNDLVINNGGTHIEMSNLKTSLNSTGTANTIATITFDVLIKKWGDSDVHIDLPTSRFLTCA